jgi:hypothetical protein
MFRHIKLPPLRDQKRTVSGMSYTRGAWVPPVDVRVDEVLEVPAGDLKEALRVHIGGLAGAFYVSPAPGSAPSCPGASPASSSVGAGSK